MKRYFVPELHEHQEVPECADGYFIVHTEDDVQPLLRKIRRWVTLVNTNELSSYEAIRQIQIDLDTATVSAQETGVAPKFGCPHSHTSKPCPKCAS